MVNINLGLKKTIKYYKKIIIPKKLSNTILALLIC